MNKISAVEISIVQSQSIPHIFFIFLYLYHIASNIICMYKSIFLYDYMHIYSQTSEGV